MLPHDSGPVVDDDGGAHDLHRAEADKHDVGHEGGRVGRVIRQRDGRTERTVQCGFNLKVSSISRFLFGEVLR